MLTAHADRDGRRIILLGLTRENVRRLTHDQPIHVAAESHPGFPADLEVLIVYAETDRALGEALATVTGPETKIVTVPRTPPAVS